MVSSTQDGVGAPSKKRKHEDVETSQEAPMKKTRGHGKRHRKHGQQESTSINGSVGQRTLATASEEMDRKKQTKRGKKRPKKTTEQSGDGGQRDSLAKVEQDEAEGSTTTREKRKRKHDMKRARVPRSLENRVERIPAALNPESSSDRKRPPRKDAKEIIAKDPGAISKKETSSQSAWSLLPPSAGRFRDYDPIFVKNAKGHNFLLSANSREVQLLSLETSLVVSTHSAPDGLSVSSVAVDAVQNNLVMIAHSNGAVVKWDWVRNESLNVQGSTQGQVLAMASVSCAGKNDSAMFYVGRTGREYNIVGQERILRTAKDQLDSIRVFGDAQYLVAHGSSTLVLGMKVGDNESITEFDWVEERLSYLSTCVDARVSPMRSANEKDEKHPRGMSLALGMSDGQIHLYDDVLTLFEQHGRKKSLPTPRILHWHRDAVSSVKFSRDGNYLISGGKETVLVLWQLETGKKQFLPHLTSEIERIVVNPEGDRYALQMGDNSIMVLSTSELKPVANFAGVQMPSSIAGLPSVPPAVTLHPRHPHLVLLTVPATQPKSAKDIAARPFLQTFDIHDSRHVARQALTRNNVTDFNLSPEGIPIVPPDVHKLAISHRGDFLATVDDWMPPASDLEFLASDGLDIQLERERRREVYLKIWSWDETLALWTLTTRIDAPHARPARDGFGAGRVLALASNPVSDGFATFGEDSCVMIWKPKSRKDKSGIEWRCKRTIHLSSDTYPAQSPIHIAGGSGASKAYLAYSNDGSLLAITQSAPGSTTAPVVHFVGTRIAPANHRPIAKSTLAETEITSIGFLGKYLIAVSHPAAYVWDLVNETLVYRIKIDSSRRSSPFSRNTKDPLLAVNTESGSFALVTSSGGKARVEVYVASQSGCLFKQDVNTEVVALLAGNGNAGWRGGFTLLLADATIRMLASPGAQSLSSAKAISTPKTWSAQDDETVAVSAARSHEVGLVGLLASSTEQDQTVLPRDDIDAGERPVVSPEQLAAIFDVGGKSLPPVKDMFRAVVQLFGRRPA